MEKSIGLKRWKIHRFLIAKDNLWKLDMQDDIIEKKVSYSHNIRNKLACTFQFKTLKTGSVLDN